MFELFELFELFVLSVVLSMLLSVPLPGSVCPPLGSSVLGGVVSGVEFSGGVISSTDGGVLFTTS